MNCTPGGGNIHSANVNLCGVWLREQTSDIFVEKTKFPVCLHSFLKAHTLLWVLKMNGSRCNSLGQEYISYLLSWLLFGVFREFVGLSESIQGVLQSFEDFGGLFREFSQV